MYVVPEPVAAELLTIDDAIAAVHEGFISLDARKATVFPVSMGSGPDGMSRFGAKSGRIDGVALGVKVGTYWPQNAGRGIPAHGSTVLLLEEATGLPLAVVGASHLTALRTAAGNAVATRALARPAAKSLLVIGTGHQAFYEAVAVSRVRKLDEVMVWGRNESRAAELADKLRTAGLPARAERLEMALGRADLIATVTASHEALIDIPGVRPGTHISAMGSDTAGKQELGVALVRAARLFADVPSQSVTIGELQHAVAQGLVAADSITPIGAVLSGRKPGRTRDDEITIFDSSGTAIQDLAVCSRALTLALAAGRAITVPDQ